MKLYPLIYTNEAARTATDALDKGIAAISKQDYGSEDEYDDRHQVVLVSIDRAVSVLRTLEKNRWPPTEETDPGESAEIGQRMARSVLAKRAIVGTVEYSLQDVGLFKVNISAGVAGFGPLAYQLVMYETGEWLMSDESLKPASQKVWQKMYELSNKGVYQRKWLGSWESNYVLDRIHIGDSRDLQEYSDKLSYNEVEESDEQSFLDFLQDRNMKPEKYGWLWAYQQTSHDPKIKDMYKKGQELIQFLVEKYPSFSEADMADTFIKAANNFFRRLYGGPASYSE